MSEAFDRAQVVILSSIDWDAAWQRHQIFAAQFAEAGHEVFFVENSGFRNPGLTDLPRLRAKLQHTVFPQETSRVNSIPSGLHVIPPRILPPTTKIFRDSNRALFVPQLAAQLRHMGMRPHPLVICYFPTATTLELLDLLAPRAVVYDCASNFRAHPQAPADFLNLERALLRRSDVVVCDSDFLYAQKLAEHGRVVQIHQGVAESFFEAAPPSETFKNACYYGTWGQDLEPKLLEALTTAGLSVTVSGFTKGDPPPLPPGVTRLPPARREDLVARLQSFDVFALPYRINPFLLGVIPAKIYECLAMGRPVIATPLPSLLPLKGLIHIAETPDEWAAAARRLPETETPELRRERIALAREHTHAAEFRRFRETARTAWDAAPAVLAAPQRRERWWEGKHAQAFLQGFTWIGLLYSLAKASTLLTQMVAGRILGPQQFGKANLVVAAAAFLQIAPMLGFPLALSKFPSAEPSEERRRLLISTTLSVFALWAFLCLAAFMLGHRLLATTLRVPDETLVYAIIFAFCTAVYIVVSSPLLGLRRFAQRGIAEIVYGLSAPVIMTALFLGGLRDYRVMIAALCLSLLGAAAYAGGSLRGFLLPAFDREAFKTVMGYAAVATLNLLTAACVVAPGRLLLHRCASPHEVGVFSAYFTATAQISLALLYSLSAVIVPLASSRDGQSEAWGTLRRLGLPLLLGTSVLFVLTALAALFVFGRNYPLRWEWVALFAFTAALILLHGIIGAVFSARDFAGLRVSVTGNLIGGLGNVGLGWVLVPAFGIPGAAAALAGSYMLGLAYYVVLAPRED